MRVQHDTTWHEIGFVEGVKKVFGGSERPPDPTVPVKVMYAPMLELCHEPQTVVTPLVRASLALHNEGALLAFLSGELSPVNMMHRLSGVRRELATSHMHRMCHTSVGAVSSRV